MTTILVRVGRGSSNAMLQIKAKLDQPAELLHELGNVLLESTHKRFMTETAPSGEKWKALSPLTLALKKGGRILTQTKALQRSIRFVVKGHELHLGPNMVYDAIQQFGGVVEAKGKALAIPAPSGKKGSKKGVMFLKRVTIPARPYIGIGADDEQAIKDKVEAYLEVIGAGQ